MTDRELEARLRAWYRTEVGADETAPTALRRDVAAIPRTNPRPARWLGRNRGLTLLAAAALLLVGGAVAAGSGLLRLPSLVPPEPVPSLVVIASPSPAEESASPAISPSPSTTPVVTARAPSWAATGSMITPRSDFAAVLLSDGKVLAMGGMNGNKALASAELYDPATGTWTATASMVSHAGRFAGYFRYGQTATLLQDGKVLVAGGERMNGGELASAELYDPVTGSWAATGSMLTPRANHTATLLTDGKVLVAGGDEAVASAELYDPVTGTWSATGSMGTARYHHVAALLRDGRVLVAGGAWSPSPWSGSLLTSAELYDPGTGTWTYARSMASPYSGNAPALLPDGRVLVGGGPPELYDPATRSWTVSGGKVIAGFGTDVLLADGGVLALGAAKPGEDNPTKTAAYLFDPGTGSWTPAGKLHVHRADFTATLLPDGKVLVAGGFDASSADGSAALATAELFDPGTWSPSPIAPATPAPNLTPYAAQPNGSMFAYIAGAGRLWVANADGTGAHELLPDAIGAQSAPAWSSDGTRLIFLQGRDGGTTGVSQLYLTDASGRAPQLVDTGCVAPCVGDTDAAFSRDGTRLVFVRTIMVPPASTKPIPNTGGKVAGDRAASVIATIDLATGQITELASTTMADCPLLPDQKAPGIGNCGGFADHNPRWSPDGTQIVFSQDVPYDINGPAEKDINGMPPPPNWPPSSIFVVDADGGNLHRVSVCCSYADWSPDGSRIVFASSPHWVLILNPGKGTGYTFKGQQVGISTVRPDGTDLRQLTLDWWSDLPSWTADGRIRFVRSIQPTNHDGPGEGHLWIMDADGSNATQISVSPDLPLDQPYGRPPKP